MSTIETLQGYCTTRWHLIVSSTVTTAFHQANGFPFATLGLASKLSCQQQVHEPNHTSAICMHRKNRKPTENWSLPLRLMKKIACDKCCCTFGCKITFTKDGAEILAKLALCSGRCIRVKEKRAHIFVER